MPAALQAMDLARLCLPMINFASDVLVPQKRFDEASSYTLEIVEFEPLLDLGWALRARYYLGTGDIHAADEAKRVKALYLEVSAYSALVETLVDDISLAKEQV